MSQILSHVPGGKLMGSETCPLWDPQSHVSYSHVDEQPGCVQDPVLYAGRPDMSSATLCAHGFDLYDWLPNSFPERPTPRPLQNSGGFGAVLI